MTPKPEQIIATSDAPRWGNGLTVVCLLVAITAAALVLRISYLHQTKIRSPIMKDAEQYRNYGWHLWQNGVFSSSEPYQTPVADSFRAPGYPLLIAAAFWAGGGRDYYAIVLHIQAVLGTLMVPMTFLLGRTFLPRWYALGAAGLVALSPHLVSMSSYMLTETLFGFLLLAAMLILVYGVRRRSVTMLAGAGACFGATFLVNQTAGMLPLLFAGGLFLGRRIVGIRPDRRMTGGLALLVLIFLLFPLAWMAHDRLVLAPDAKRGSDRLLATMTHGTYPDFMFWDPRYRNYPYRDDPESAVYRSSFGNFTRIFWSRFRHRPGRYLTWYLIQKPYILWTWNILQGEGDVYVYGVVYSLYDRNTLALLTHRLMKWSHPLVLGLTLVAFILYARQTLRSLRTNHPWGRSPDLLLLTLAAYTLFYTLVTPWPRYAVPLRPELYLCAVWGLYALTTRTILRLPDKMATNPV